MPTVVRLSSRGGSWVPEWRGNQAKPAGDQVAIEWRHCTEDERMLFIGFDYVGKRGEARFRHDSQGMIRSMCTRITNLVVDDDGKETSITTGTELLALPTSDLHDLVTECDNFFLNETLKLAQEATQKN